MVRAKIEKTPVVLALVRAKIKKKTPFVVGL